MLLIEGGYVYDHGGNTDKPARADVLIDGNRIAAVGPDLKKSDSRAQKAQVIDGRDRMLVPGFYNAHYHSHDTLQKGMFETIPLTLWGILALPPSYPRRSKRELRVRTLMGAIECLYSGITTVQDMDRVHPFDPEDIDVVLKAYDEIGIRCVFAPHITHLPTIDGNYKWKELIPESERWRIAGPAGPLFPPGADIPKIVEDFIKPRMGRYERVTMAVGPGSPERVSRENLGALADMARRLGISYYIHLNESRDMAMQGFVEHADHDGSMVKYLEACGAMGPRTSLAHSVWLTQDEIEIFARTGATAAFNPVGNLKTRSGSAPYRRFLEAGVNVGLGCDNCSCSDAQNMWQAMKMFCCLAAIADIEPGRPSAPDALRAACLGGPKAAGLEGQIGEIKPGFLADLSMVDMTDPSFVPYNSAARQLVYTEAGRGVRTVIVDGKVVIDKGKMTNFDEKAFREEVADVMIELVRDAAGVADRIEPIKKYILEAVKQSWDVPYPEHRYIGNRMGKG